MTKRRRIILISIAVVAALVAAAVVILNSPGVQRSAWLSLTKAIENRSGVLLEADDVRFRGLPARLVIRGLKVDIEGRTVLTAEEIRADWKWRRLASQPRRVENIVVLAPVVFGDAFPPPTDEPAVESEFDLRGVEIGSLEISDGRASAGMEGIRAVLEGVSMRAGLERGTARADVKADHLRLERMGRELALGPLSLEVDASQDAVGIRKFVIDGAEAGLSSTGRLTMTPGMAGRFDAEIEADIPAVASWWDPNLVTGLAPNGRAVLTGEIEISEGGRLSAHFIHRGRPMELAGYDLEALELTHQGGRSTVRLAGPGWGRADVMIDEAGVTSVSAELDEAPVDRLLEMSAPLVGQGLRGPTTLTGRFKATFAFPVDPETLSAEVDLLVGWADGRVAVEGAGVGTEWSFPRVDAHIAGVVAEASGTVGTAGEIRADAEVTISDPGLTAAALQPWYPDIGSLEIGGGPISAAIRVGGTVADPALEWDLSWVGPEAAGRSFTEFSARGAGGIEEIRWQGAVEIEGDSTLFASGTAHPSSGSVAGEWEVSVPDLARAAEALAPGVDLSFNGGFSGVGSMMWNGDTYRLDGRVAGRNIATESLAVPNLKTAFVVEPGSVTIEDLRIEVADGLIEGRMKAPLADVDGVVEGVVSWTGLDLAALPASLTDTLSGRVSGRVEIRGTVSRPEGTVSVLWEGSEPHPVIDSLRLHAGLTDGVVDVVLEDAATSAGLLVAHGKVPLGDIERPPWLWAEAPEGPVSGHLRLDGFRSGPVVQWLSIDALGTEAFADLTADFEWDPAVPDHPRIEASARGLRVTHPTGQLTADAPVEVRVDGRKIHIEPVTLTGFESRIEVEASYDPVNDGVDAVLNATVSETLARLLPMPIRIRGPLSVNGRLHLPASADASIESVIGTFEVDHGDGSMVMRDPPVEIKGLMVSAALQDGRIDILDGRAEVNRGSVLMGGGWDPVTGQGLVFEMRNVMLFFEGILTRWDGDLAVEPRNDKIAHVTGDLTLMAGLWDETFGLASTFLGSEELELAADDPLHDISLDLAVRGRSGIRVDNNLGRFDVNWDVLRIDGSAAAPRLRGEVRIAPGGVIGLGGRDVKVRRGSLDFTGDPTVDPIVEIVPESDMTLVGGEEGDASLDPTLMATRGLAQGLSSVLGFENETLRPAEIATQTERDPSVNFMVGQRISRNLALFLTANLTDVQDRTAMIQGWNFRGLRGLVLQAYQETVDDNFGGNILQRFTWGGSTGDLGRPEVHRLRLEGDWPMSKKQLKKATRLRRGQPYEPFLLFVAAVRMERALAENGYQNARVTGFREGDERSPTLVFYCDPGEPQFVRFEGDQPPRQVRAEVTAMYEPPPLEKGSLAEMTALLTRHLGMEGYPNAEVVVDRREELIFVDIERGSKVEVLGPFIDGVPFDIARMVGRQLGSANVIATMVDRPAPFERAIVQKLAALGYLEAKVLSVDVVRQDEFTSEVRFSVEAGPRLKIDEVVFGGSDPLQLAGTGVIEVRPGQPLDRTRLDLAARDLRDAYIAAGYRDARARSEVRQDEEGRWVVEINLEPGALRRLRKVEYSGVRHASRKVLDKGLVLDDGEVVTDAAVDQSANRIANFSPIERVEVHTRDVGSSEVDVEFAVTEKPRWAAEVGGGWSTERGFAASFGIRDDALFGRGVGLNLRGGWGSTEQKLLLIGSVPPVPGGRLSFISTVGFRSGDAPEEPDLLDQEEFLASLEAQYVVASRIQVGLYYRWTDTRTFEKDPDPFNPFPVDVRVKLGTIGGRTVIDRFDNLFDPRRGYGLTTDLGWSASAFGSDFNYVSWLTNFTLALEPFSGATWLQTARAGIAEPLRGENLIPEARYFAGGQASVRGFDLNSVGPVTFGIGGTLVPEGGGALFILNEELRIPVWGALRAAVFADIGQVWSSWSEADLELSIGAGVGLRWSTPIGPLWFDVAWPVANVGISSKKTKFYLGIGRPF